MPAGAVECVDCGRSLEEMEQTRVERMESDRVWIPPRQIATSRRRSRGKSGPRPASPSWPSPRAVEASRRLLLAGGALAFLAGVAITGFWLALVMSPKMARHGKRPTPVPAVVKPTASAPVPSTVRLDWRNPYPEIRMELLNKSGRTVASSSGPLGATVRRGRFLLRLVDKKGRWKSPTQVVAAPAGTWTLVPTPSLVADYYLWLGKRLHASGESLGAERAWRKAIQASPACSEARLELAALLAVRFQYSEAKRLVQNVTDQSPQDERAQRLLKALGELERKQR